MAPFGSAARGWRGLGVWGKTELLAQCHKLFTGLTQRRGRKGNEVDKGLGEEGRYFRVRHLSAVGFKGGRSRHVSLSVRIGVEEDKSWALQPLPIDD